MSEPGGTVRSMVNENNNNVGREIFNLLSNILALRAMLPHYAIEWLVGVLGGTYQAFL